MKKTFKAISRISLASIFGATVLASCGTDPNSPGVEYMPDMYRSPTIEPYVDYAQVRNVENFDDQSDKISALVPPMGTVPNFGSNFKNNMPFGYYPPKSIEETHGLKFAHYDENGYNNSANAVNPIMLHAGNQKQVLKEGKHLYENNCIQCHGEKGDGKGSIVKSGAYTGVPDYKTLNIAPGQMMFSISYGKGQMGAHMSQLTTEERWKLVHYVEALQNGGKAKLDGNIGIDMSDSMNVSTESVVLKDIYFNFGGTDINKNRRNKSLFALLNFMSQNPDVNVELSGHTDNIGTPEGNLEVSKKRAESVKAFLVDYGINGSRITTAGYGLTKPIADNSTDEGRAINRRTEVKILK